MSATDAARVAVLTNFVPPYRLGMHRELNRRLGELRIFVAEHRDMGLGWEPETADLDVQSQRTLSLPSPPRRHPLGFREEKVVEVEVSALWNLVAYRPDLIVSTELGARTTQAMAYGAATGVPVIVVIQISTESERGRGRTRDVLRPQLLRRAAAVVVPGASGARYVSRHGARPGRVHVVHPSGALPETPVTPPAPDGAARRLLYVGRLIELKGLVPFVESLARWGRDNPERPVEMTVLGDGPMRGRLTELPLPPSVRLSLPGAVPYEEAVAAYAAADVAVMPTLSDVWGQVVNEALANGRPVLGSVYAQAVDELVVEGRNGWRFRPDDESSTREALDRALSASPSDLIRMARAAQDSVAHLTAQRAASDMVDVFEAVLCESRRFRRRVGSVGPS